MKFKHILAAALAMLCLAGCGEGEPVETAPPESIEVKSGSVRPGSYYQNKITDSAADPFILEHDGTYYLYSTGGSRFTVRTSKDLVVWQEQSTPILRLSQTMWAKKNGWAPEMYEYNDKFYLIFSAQNEDGIHCIDIATCDRPDGVFQALDIEPFFAPGYSVIDGSLFFDDDGRIYMYYSKDCSTNVYNGKKTSQTYGVEVAADFSGIIGEPVLISTPEQDWELKSGNTLWNEGPVVFKENGTYYLLYSANFYQSEHYSVGYATSDSPLKRFEKPEKARLLSGNGDTVTGPGHCNILRSPDGTELYAVYHVHTVPPNTDHGRSLAIDRIIIKDDGSLAIDGPTEARRPVPSGLGGYYRITDGFSYEGTGELAEIASFSDIDNLFDGVTKRSIEGIFSMQDGGTVTLTFDAPAEVGSIWVYPSTQLDYKPESVDLEINGMYVIKDRAFAATASSAAVFNLSNLPSGTLVETLKITVNGADGNTYAALAEISLVTNQQK